MMSAILLCGRMLASTAACRRCQNDGRRPLPVWSVRGTEQGVDAFFYFEWHVRRALFHLLHVLQQQVDFNPAGGGSHALARCPVVQLRQWLVEPGGVVARLELRYQLLLFG